MDAERTTTRILRLYQMEELLLTKNGLSAIELARILGANRRTIYRDLGLMTELGIPLCRDERGFTILGTYKVPSYRAQIVEQADA